MSELSTRSIRNRVITKNPGDPRETREPELCESWSMTDIGSTDTRLSTTAVPPIGPKRKMDGAELVRQIALALFVMSVGWFAHMVGVEGKTIVLNGIALW